MTCLNTLRYLWSKETPVEEKRTSKMTMDPYEIFEMETCKTVSELFTFLYT